MKNMITLLTASTLAFTLPLPVGCDAEPDAELDTQMELAEDGEALDVCDDPRAPSWDNFAEGFVLNWCHGCHSAQLVEGQRSDAPLGVDFGSHEAVLAQLDRVEARAAAEAPTMPPAGGPSPAELELLRQWIACGAPE